MMSYELISEEEYASLPTEDDRCFVEFENICRRNMTRMIDENTNDFSNSNSLDTSVREQYMAAVAAVARECHIPNIEYDPKDDVNFGIVFSQFSLAVQGEVAKIRIRSRGEHHPYSVLLTGSTRTKIEFYIARIRDIIDHSDLDLDRKKQLNEKLDNLAAELAGHRLSFAKTMAILLVLVTALSGTVTIAAEGQSAITHIMQLIGHDKETENTAARRLAPTPKALPAPAAKLPSPRRSAAKTSKIQELDDDIPF